MVLTSTGPENTSESPRKRQGKQICIVARGDFLSLQLCTWIPGCDQRRRSKELCSSLQCGCVVSRRVASTGGDEVLDGVDGLDAAEGADGGAVERGGGTGEIELARQGPTLQEPVNKARMKNVTSAGGVHRLNSKCRGVVEARAVPGQNALFAQSRGGEAAAKAIPERGQGLPQIRFFHQPPRDIPAGDEEVNAFQERVHAGIKFVQVSDDGDACGARPACRGGRSRGVVTIYVKSAGMNDPIALEFFGAQSQAVVALPKNGAFAGVIDKDESMLAGTAGRGEEVRLDAEARKFRAMELGGDVVPDLAHVARAQAPLLAGNHCGGHLA